MQAPGALPAETDPEVAAAVRLLHRRRGWIWATVIGLVAWLVAAGLLGALTPNDDSGAGVVVGSVFVVLLTVVVAVGLVASVVDTVRLRRRDPGIRRRAGQLVDHHPVGAHAYRYPARHRFGRVFGWIMLLALLGLAIPALPGLVDGIAYVAGAEPSTTFTPVSYGQVCGRGGCHTVTDGVLASGASASWPDQVPLDQSFPVAEPAWNWGFGTQLIDGGGSAAGLIAAGVFLEGAAAAALFFLVLVVRSYWRYPARLRRPR